MIRGLDHHLQSHCDDHLNLRNVVGGSGDEAGDREILHLLAADVHDMAEQLLPNGDS